VKESPHSKKKHSKHGKKHQHKTKELNEIPKKIRKPKVKVGPTAWNLFVRELGLGVKIAAEKWKVMSTAEKAPYLDKAQKMKDRKTPLNDLNPMTGSVSKNGNFKSDQKDELKDGSKQKIGVEVFKETTEIPSNTMRGKKEKENNSNKRLDSGGSKNMRESGNGKNKPSQEKRETVKNGNTNITPTNNHHKNPTISTVSNPQRVNVNNPRLDENGDNDNDNDSDQHSIESN